MNVLYLTNHLNIGGITSYVFTLAKGLKEKGHNIYVASSEGERLKEFIENGIVYFRLPIKIKSEASPKILICMFKLSSLIRKNHIDILHSNSRTTQVLGCALSRIKGVVHISTCHGFFKKRISRKIFPCWGNKVIAISEATREHLTRDLGVKEELIKVIPSGVDIEKFKIQSLKSKNKIKEELGLTDGPVVGTIARLSEEKGHNYLIEAMQTVLEKIPQAQLIIVGQGRTKDLLLSLIRTLKIEKNVFLIPTVLDTRQMLMAMDLFVLPSLKEGLGLSLMEAMALGLPVIGSDVGGIKSLIRHGDNGLLVKPADSRGLSSAIIELLQDLPLAESLGRNARIFIAENFSQETMIEETERFYLGCLKTK